MLKDSEILRSKLNKLQEELQYEFRMDMFSDYGACVNLVQVRMSQNRFTGCMLRELSKLPLDKETLKWVDSLVDKPLHFRKRHCRVTPIMRLLNAAAIREDITTMEDMAKHINLPLHKLRILNKKGHIVSARDLDTIYKVLKNDKEKIMFAEVVLDRNESLDRRARGYVKKRQ